MAAAMTVQDGPAVLKAVGLQQMIRERRSNTTFSSSQMCESSIPIRLDIPLPQKQRCYIFGQTRIAIRHNK
jgi:hypothetical protein